MDDMASKISEILQDPQAMEQIRGLAGMFGQGAGMGEAPPSAPQPDSRQTMAPVQQDAMPSLSPEMMGMMVKLMPLMANMNKETQSKQLLRALRPMLSERRKKKLDEAARIMQLIQILPELKKSGIF